MRREVPRSERGVTVDPLPEVDPVPHIDDRAEEIILKHVGTLFRIDDDGTVWRIAWMQKGKRIPCEPRRAEYPRNDGYLRVRLMINGIRIRASAHRLVFRYFKGAIPRNAIINHGDGVRSNNHPDNLSPMSQSDNVHHGNHRRSPRKKN